MHSNESVHKPYVISCDLASVLSGWAKERDLTLPSNGFFAMLRESMHRRLLQMFPHVEMLSEAYLCQQMEKIAAQQDLPIINLDQVYTKIGYPLQVSRAVDADGNDSGIANRTGTPSIEEQVYLIAKHCQGTVVLTDDVIFSGSLLVEQVIPRLREQGVFVTNIFAAVGIASGIKRLESAGVKVECLHVYEEVLDEICERDFYPGVPNSGRSVSGFDGFGMPYVKTFGNIVDWASIPEEFADSFSQFCIEQTICLFQEIEKCSGRPVGTEDVSRAVFGLKYSSCEESHASALQRYLNRHCE